VKYAFDILTLDCEICDPSPWAYARQIWRGYSRDGHFRVRQARVLFGGTVLASVKPIGSFAMLIDL